MSMFDDGFFCTTKIRLTRNVKVCIRNVGDKPRKIILGTGVVDNDGHYVEDQTAGDNKKKWVSTPDFVDFSFTCAPNARLAFAVGLKGETFRVFGNLKKKVDKKKMASEGTDQTLYKYVGEIMDAELCQQFLSEDEFKEKEALIAAEDPNYMKEIGSSNATATQGTSGYAKKSLGKPVSNKAAGAKTTANKPQKPITPPEEFDDSELDDIAF